VLLHQARFDPTARRISAGLTALIIGVLTFTALGALMIRARQLSLFDVIAVVGVGLGAVGHIVLGLSILFAGARFPLRRSLTADLLLLCACLSIVAGIVGAIGVWTSPPVERIVRGVQVSGVFEFGVTSTAYALPGLLLLAMRAVSYRHPHSPRKNYAPPTRTDNVSSASFSVDALRVFHPGEISQAWNGANRPTSPTVERFIRQAWEAQTALAAENPGSLFNGDLVRVIRVVVAEKKLHFDLGSTCFRDFLGTNLLNASTVIKSDARYLADALGVSSIVLTSDGFVALGRRSDLVAYHAGFLHTFGGLVETTDRDESGEFDFFAAAVREMGEELNITSKDISTIVAMGVIRDRKIHQPELLFDVTISLSKTELSACFDSHSPAQEHTGIEFVHDDPDAVLPFLSRSGPVAPVAEAGLLIHGRRQWGSNWYEQACYVLYGELPAVDCSA